MDASTLIIGAIILGLGSVFGYVTYVGIGLFREDLWQREWMQMSADTIVIIVTTVMTIVLIIAGIAINFYT